MRELWRRLEVHLKNHAPAALVSLNPPATKKQIQEAERELGVKFPVDFAESLQIHNGQKQETGKPPHPILIIPQEHEDGGIYRATYGGLASLELVVDRTKISREIIKQLPIAPSDYEFSGPVRRDGKWSWITFVDSGSGDILALDLNPDDQGQIGQVLSVIHDPSCLFVLAPSYFDWFQSLVQRFETGRYTFEGEEDGELDAIDLWNSQSRHRDDSIDGSDDDENDLKDGIDILRFPGH